MVEAEGRRCVSTVADVRDLDAMIAFVDGVAEELGSVDILIANAGISTLGSIFELDAIGSSNCVQQMGSMPGWEADLRYEMKALQALPHTVVYVEGGYSDSNSVSYTARVLKAIDVNTIPRISGRSSNPALVALLRPTTCRKSGR